MAANGSASLDDAGGPRQRVEYGDQRVERGAGGETHQVAGAACPPHDPAGRGRRRRPEHAARRRPRPGCARGLPLPREDLPLRPRADPRARRSRPRLRGARLLRELRAAERPDPRRPVPAGRRADAGVRPLLDRRGQQGVGRPGPRRARVRGQALHQGGQLGSRRQQHPGLLHPGRHQVPGPHPRRQAGARPRLPAGPDRARQLLGLRLADAREPPTC